MLLGRPLMASRFWEEGVMDGDNTSNKNRDRGGRGQTIWDAICGRPLKEKTYSIRKALLRSKLCISTVFTLSGNARAPVLDAVSRWLANVPCLLPIVKQSSNQTKVDIKRR